MSLLSLHYCGFWKGVIMPAAVQNLIILKGVFRVITLSFAFALLHLTLRYYALNINQWYLQGFVCLYVNYVRKSSSSCCFLLSSKERKLSKWINDIFLSTSCLITFFIFGCLITAQQCQLKLICHLHGTIYSSPHFFAKNTYIYNVWF